MTERYVWRVYCTDFDEFQSVISTTEPTLCPSNSGPIDSSKTCILESVFVDIISQGYINIESQLSDNQAIKINASDTNGGIDINAGLGGITVDTTNGISLDGGAACNFTTTNGNLTLEATAGLVNIDGGSGLNIGNGSSTTPIGIGTTSFAKTIAIGNLTGASSTSIQTGTGGFNVDTANGGAISLDATGASCNFSLITNANSQDLTIGLFGANDSSLILMSQGTGTDALSLIANNGDISVSAFGSTKTITLATAFAGSGNIKLSSGAGGSGSLTFESGSGGIVMNSYTGTIGIGNFSGGDVLIGTAAVARTLTVGNTTSTTAINVSSGTGGFNVDTANGGTISLDAIGASSNFTLTSNADSQDLTISVSGSHDSSLILNSDGTGTDALSLIANNGDITMTAFGSTKTITLATAFAGSGNIKLSSGAGGTGSLTFESGSGGIVLNAYTGTIGIGNFSGGDIQIGTASAARTITMGNTTSTTSLVLTSGSGGIAIGNDTSSGEIQIGNVNSAKTITFGNSSANTRVFQRFGTAGIIRHQEAATSLSDADATLTIADILKVIFVIVPTVDRTLTLPTAANAVAGISGVQVNDSIDFIIINESTATNEANVIIAAGTGGSIEGNDNIAPKANNAGTYKTSGSGTFRIRFTNVTNSTEAYIAYRI